MKDEELLELTASEPLSLTEEYEMQKSWFEDNDKCTFIILDMESMDKTGNETDAMIGDVNLYLNDQDNPKAAEIEIMIAEPKHRSMGKGKEALFLMMRYGIETLNLEKFTAKIKVKNNKSIELFKKIGFKETNRSEIFQEIEMSSDVQNVKNLLCEMHSYEIKDY